MHKQENELKRNGGVFGTSQVQLNERKGEEDVGHCGTPARQSRQKAEREKEGDGEAVSKQK